MRRLIALALLASLAACHGKGERHAVKALIAENCGSCHTVPEVRGAKGRVGPSLAGIAGQQIIAGHFPNTPDTLTRWIMHPQQMLPGNAMPEMGLTEPQARSIATYLYSLDEK